MVSSNYFATLAVPLAAGREFNAAEERPGANIPVVIVNYERWRDAGFSADFIGRTVKINARDFTVVGVAPRGFTGTMALVGRSSGCRSGPSIRSSTTSSRTGALGSAIGRITR